MICASTVSAPVLVTRKVKASRRVDRAADHIGAGALGDRPGLSGQHRFVDERGAFDHLPVDRHFFARLDQNDVADDDILESDFDRRSIPQDARGLGLEADQMLDGRTGAALRPRLQAAAKQDQRHDHGGGFEIDVRGSGRKQARREGDERGIGEGGAGAERDERVHIGGAAPQRRESCREKAQARPEQNQRGQDELDDPARLHADRVHDEHVNGGKQVRAHFEREDGRRQSQGQEERARELLRFPPRRSARRWCGRVRLDLLRRITSRGCRLGENPGIRDPRHKAHRPGFGGQIDIGLDHAGNFLERLLDVIHAGGAAHFLDVEPRRFNRGPITRLADRRDDRGDIGRSRKGHLGALRREIDRGRSNARRGGNRLSRPARRRTRMSCLRRQD